MKTVGQKSGRRVLIQHYFEKIGTERIITEYLLFDRRVPMQHYFEKNRIERIITEYLLFDQQNVLLQIWQPESTNTAVF